LLGVLDRKFDSVNGDTRLVRHLEVKQRWARVDLGFDHFDHLMHHLGIHGDPFIAWAWTLDRRLPPDRMAVWSKYSNVLKPWVMSSRAERLPWKTLRIKCDRLTLCYFRFWNALAWHRKLIARKYGSGPPPEMEALVVRMAHQQSAPARKERWTVAFRPACSSVFHGVPRLSQPIFAGKRLTPLRVPTVPSVPR
jgi:hypothetical protein